MPKFNSISISGYHMQEAGATLVQELAFTLADGKEYVQTAIARGMDVDDFAGRLSFFFAIGMNFFMEAAKLRAARFLWHRIMSEFAPKKPRQPDAAHPLPDLGRVSLQEQDPYNNIVRTAYEAMCGGAGRHPVAAHQLASTRRWRCRPSSPSRIARNTQLILQNETGVTKVVDPLAGSLLRREADRRADRRRRRALIDEVEAMGGMTKAVASGMPKLRIEEAAARRQAAVDRGDEVIVGVNKFRLETEDPVEIRDIDNVGGARRPDRAAGAGAGRARRRRLRRRRWRRWRPAARDGTGNLLALAVEAARARATVGEISMAMEKAFGRHRAEVKTLAGVYGAAYEGDAGFAAIQQDVEAFAEEEGRRPRMLVVKMGQDGHDRGAKVIATAFADIGFDVDVGPLFQTPEEAAQDAVDNDVHVVGISSQAAGHKTLAPQADRGAEGEGRRRHSGDLRRGDPAAGLRRS